MRGAAESSALVLFSGGQDSTTCLAWALANFEQVETVGFDYGQRHRIELDARQAVLKRLRSDFPLWNPRLGEDHILDLGFLGQISETALTRNIAITSGEGIPNTFVPGRNLIFLAVSAVLAYRQDTSDIVIGVCETDYSGYPDCRQETIDAMQSALSFGMARRFTLHTPLMWIDKAATWRLAATLGGQQLVDIIRDEAHTCYEGDAENVHDWGAGCGICPACKLRAQGFRTYVGEAA